MKLSCWNLLHTWPRILHGHKNFRFGTDIFSWSNFCMNCTQIILLYDLLYRFAPSFNEQAKSFGYSKNTLSRRFESSVDHIPTKWYVGRTNSGGTVGGVNITSSACWLASASFLFHHSILFRIKSIGILSRTHLPSLWWRGETWRGRRAWDRKLLQSFAPEHGEMMGDVMQLIGKGLNSSPTTECWLWFLWALQAQITYIYVYIHTYIWLNAHITKHESGVFLT